MIPSVGAFLRGDPTEAHTWCPTGTVGNQSTIQYYPQGDSEPVQSDVLAATVVGQHVLGAEWNSGNTITLSDIAISGTTPPGTTTTTSNNTTLTLPAACPVTTNATTGVQTMTALTINSTYTQQTISNVSATEVNQVLTGATPVPVSGGTGTSLAFITYNGTTTGASLPYYLPPATGTAAGTLGYVTLTGSSNITAPLAGAFSPDNTLFFVSTAGDNMIHYITIPSSITSRRRSRPTPSRSAPICLAATRRWIRLHLHRHSRDDCSGHGD